MKNKVDRPEQAAASASSGQTLRRRAEEIALKNAARSAENFEALPPEETRQTLHELRVHQIELEMQNEELRRTQGELAASQARYSELFDAAPVGYFTVSEKGLIREANLTATGLLGMVKSTLVKQPLSRFILQEDQDLYYRFRRRIIETDVPQVCELRMLRMDKTTFWARLEGGRVESAEGVLMHHAVVSDITTRKRMEEDLRESEKRQRLTLEAINDGLWDWDIPTGNAVFSPRWYTMLGYEPYEFPQNYDSWRSLLHPEDVGRAEQEINAHIASGEGYAIEIRMQTKTGGWRWILSRGKVVEQDADGQPIRMVGTHSDITERKSAEEERLRLEWQLHQSEKLKALGAIATGVAHEIRNPLATINFNAQMLQRELSLDPTQAQMFEDLVQEIKKIDRIVQQVYHFALPREPRFLPNQLNDIVRHCHDLSGIYLRLAHVDIVLNLAEGLPSLLMDFNQMSQGVMNLVINAIEAMPEGGKLSLATMRRQDPPAVILELKDTGAGIVQEDQDRIFDPFFTTKPEGTGLGLSVSRQILKKNGFEIEVDSTPGDGTVFRIVCPWPLVCGPPDRRIGAGSSPVREGSFRAD